MSKCDQIWSSLPIWSHLLKKSLMENLIICAVKKNYEVITWQALNPKYTFLLLFLEVYLEPCQVSVKEPFWRIVNGF